MHKMKYSPSDLGLFLLDSLLEPVFRDLLLVEPFVPEVSLLSCSSLLLQVGFNISESKLLSSFFISARLPIHVAYTCVYINFIHVHVASNVHYYYIQLGTSCVLAGSPQKIWLYLMLWEKLTYTHHSCFE